MKDINALAEQEVRREVEGLSREEVLARLREIAEQKVEEPRTLEDMIRHARAVAASKLLRELEPQQDSYLSLLREINEKLDRVLQLLREGAPQVEKAESSREAEKTEEAAEAELSDLARDVLEFLREKQGAGFREIVNYLGKSREEVMKAISELFDSQLIKKEGYVYVVRA